MTTSRNFTQQADETARGLAIRISQNLDTATPADVAAAWSILEPCAHMSEALLTASHRVYEVVAA